MANRVANIDTVKTLSLIFLYLSHSTLFQQTPQISEALQSFLDTAFMFLAGYLCKKSLENREYKFAGFWKNKAKTLLIPFWAIIIVWYFTQRVPFRPSTAFLAYGLGLRALALPSTWDLFSLWFASCLVGYFLIFSVVGKHKKLRIIAVLVIIVGACVHFSTVNIENRLVDYTFIYYLLPFAVGFFWKLTLSSKKNLVLFPASLLLGLSWLNIPVAGDYGRFTSIIVNWGASLLSNLSLVLLSLYVFNKIKHKGLNRVFAWVASGSLIAYLMEPILGMWTGLLLFPQNAGGVLTNASIQFSLTPTQSVIRLIVALPIGLLLSPLFYKGYLKACKIANSLRIEGKFEWQKKRAR